MNPVLDIVELIENHPISRLTSTYQNKLLTKIKETFTDTQQKLFVSSFYCYLNYNQTSDFVIDLDSVWQWLGFQQKQTAKLLIEKNFVIERDYKMLHIKQEQHGGHNKQTILMNIQTFKLLCLKSNTKKADEIHNYYLNMENMLHQIVEEECQEFKLNCITLEQKVENEKVVQKEQVLLTQFKQAGPIVYIIKVKTFDNGQYVVKIGESRVGIEGRFTEHKKNYPECVLLDCYSVVKSKEFEHFIHTHAKIRLNKVKDLPDHERENELFRIGNDLSYDTLSKIIKDNLHFFNCYGAKDYQLLQAENELLRAQKTNGNTVSQDVLLLQTMMENMLKPMQNQLEKLEKQNKELLETLNSNKTNTATGFNELKKTVGPRLQKINPENLSLVHVYETVSEALSESYHKLKRATIQGAVSENTIYQGFRWALVERDLDPQIVNVPPTRHSKVQNLGYIAKMDENKTEIVNVYIDRKTASLQNGFAKTYLDFHVKNNRLVQGFYYLLLDNCPDELQTAFFEKNGPPILYREGVGRFDSENNLIQEYTTKYNLIKMLPISDKTLAKTLDTNVLYKNFYFRKIPPKLFV